CVRDRCRYPPSPTRRPSDLAKLRLVPRPRHTAIGILAFETLDDALDAVVPCLECRPAAVELMDDLLLDLTRKSRQYAQYLASFVDRKSTRLNSSHVKNSHAV